MTIFKFTLFLILNIFILNKCISQIPLEFKQTIDKATFERNLSGVRDVFYNIDINTFESLKNNNPNSNVLVYQALDMYLRELGFENVYSPLNTQLITPSSTCNYVYVYASWNYSNKYYSNIMLDFDFCNGESFPMTSNNKIYDLTHSGLQDDFLFEFRSMHPNPKKPYQLQFRKKTPSNISKWNKNSLKNYMENNSINSIEGIYEGLVDSKLMPKYELAIVKQDDFFNIIYIDGAHNFEDWSEGEIQGNVSYTAMQNVFKVKWKGPNKFLDREFLLSYDNGILTLMNEKEKHSFIKLFPSLNSSKNENISILRSTGTGFAISSEGLIVTNFHVVSGANLIKVTGIDGDITNSFSASILISDEKNDLSILKITDPKFTRFATIPYVISNKQHDVGTNIFVLGYPLPNTMGSEIKLTNGIISSKTGFKGDPTSYQVSAPIQAGNSGGPLFSDNGEIIGVISAKHLDTENVSYAIKPMILNGLLNTLDKPTRLPNINSLSPLSLTEKVKKMKKFIYLLEIY